METSQPPLLLTNYRGSGIGDFGAELAQALRAEVPELVVEETPSDGAGWRAQLGRVAGWRGPLIANVGLTGWGPSGLRNFLGLRAVAAHQRRHQQTVFLIHHVIEMLVGTETGYHVTRLRQIGAHRALQSLTGVAGVTFSSHLDDLLRSEYDWIPRLVCSLPCIQSDQVPAWSDSGGSVVSLGYWAPYKGIGTFVRVGAQLRGRFRCVLMGEPHKILSMDARFRELAASWRAGAAAAGVELPGFVAPAELSRYLRGPVVALLPYAAMSGASASLATLAGLGVPVIASDLPEFREARAAGAAVTTVPGGVNEYAQSVVDILSNRLNWESLVSRQRRYASANSWSNFARRLLEIIYAPEGASKPSDPANRHAMGDRSAVPPVVDGGAPLKGPHGSNEPPRM